MRPVSLYVHVPFCRRRCPYCTFYHVPDIERRYEAAFVAALVGEFESAIEELGEGLCIPTVYIGGGTPSVLARHSIQSLFDRVVPHVDPAANGSEITVEVNPEDVTAESIDTLAGFGVNRVSVGVQSMSKQGQNALGRCAPEVNERAVTHVRKRFNNFNLDLLLGIPGHTLDKVAVTLDRISEFNPPHLSVYCLEPGGVLESQSESFFDNVDQERTADEYLFVCERLREQGYHHYEVSNFALPGFESRHNRVYWRGGEYLGVGPGAHSFLAGERYFNTASIDDYLSEGASLQNSIRQHEHRDEPQRRLEEIMLGLRTSDGLPIGDLTTKSSVIDDLVGEGLARAQSGGIVLSDRGFLLLNEIVHRLTSGE